MDPEVYAAFQTSTQVSSKFLWAVVFIHVSIAVNGRGVNMLKAGTKRRRTKAELEDFKLEEEMKEEEQQRLQQRVANLER